MKNRLVSVYLILVLCAGIFTGCGTDGVNFTTSEDTSAVETANESTAERTAADVTASVEPEKEASEAQPASVYPYTFTDSTGAEFTLEEKPERVAVLFSSYAEIWQLAGGTVDITVGDSVERGFADAGAVLVNDGAGFKIDNEALVASEPDFVIASADLSAQVEACDTMNSNGVPSALFHEETIEDYLTILKIFTDITGNSDAYITYGEDVLAEYNQIIKDRKLPEDSDVTYLFIRCGSAADTTKAKKTDDHFACAMLSSLGAVNIADEYDALTEELSLESIIEADPDYIIITPQGDEEAATAYMNELLSEDGWKDVPAVKEGRYTFVSKRLFNYKPNQYFAEALQILADIVNPE